ncbi:putative uncharacterized protein [Clostridium sp. CAG:411]|jgi:holin-like protein|nr:CidA/LrgA family protein [Lachnospiraceae bacterium]CDE42152.1 putative uncharacterized protein [Clostridium sp. CAG:411]
MKYVRQFLIILSFSFAGEFLHTLLPLPIPASIYGIILLFLALNFNLLAVDSIRETSNFLIEIMPVLFIPAAVGILETWGLIRVKWASYLVITLVSTIIVMVVSGHVTQAIMRSDQKQEKQEQQEEQEEVA